MLLTDLENAVLKALRQWMANKSKSLTAAEKSERLFRNRTGLIIP